MTIAQTEVEVRELIKQHHVYGLEVIMEAIVAASVDEPYINEAVIHALAKAVYDRKYADLIED